MKVVAQLVHLRANRSATCHVRKSNLHQRLTIVWPCLFGLLSHICSLRVLRVKFKWQKYEAIKGKDERDQQTEKRTEKGIPGEQAESVHNCIAYYSCNICDNSSVHLC